MELIPSSSTDRFKFFKKEKNTMEKKVKTCCLCGKEIEGFGNDPRPVMEAFGTEGWNVCCDECNVKRVIPARLKGLHTGDIKTEEN